MFKNIRSVSIALLSLFLIAVIGVALSGKIGAQRAVESEPRGPTFLGAEEQGGEVEAQRDFSDTSAGGPVAGEAVAPASFDGDLRNLPQIAPTKREPMREFKIPRFSEGGVVEADPVVQSGFGVEAMPSPIVSFKGLDLNTWGAGWPPDTNGDVGPNHYIQTVNTSIGIYNKTGTQLAAFTFDTFFNGTGTICDSGNSGDPVVLYDALSDRWILTDFAWSDFVNGPYYECIAVSKTADPVSGGWWMYGFRADDDTHKWLNDYPKLGVWADGIYMGANMFDIINNLGSAYYKGVRVWALDRDDMINGLPLRSVRFDIGAAYDSVFPANQRGALPPSGAPNYFFGSLSSPTLRMWKFHVDWVNTANSTFTGPTNITVASFSMPSSNVPQKSGESVDTLGDRLMVQVQYRNFSGTEAVWVNHTVASGGVTGVRWYEIRNPNTTPTVYQQSTYQPDSTYRWMGSLAVDGQGNMAVGYSVSSSTMFPAIRYAGRLASDPLGQLSQGETTLIAGTGSQSGGYNRWGDYSAMTVDPSDDCTFWYTTEYYETTGSNWQTRIGSFKFPSCGSGPTPTPTATPIVTPTPTPTATPPPTSTGFKSPTANVAESSGDKNGFEVSPTNAYSDNSLFAVDNNSGNGTSTLCTNARKDRHQFYDYSFNIPAGATIKGIEVRLDAKVDSTSGSPKMCVFLSWNGGVSWTAAKSTTTLSTGETSYILGSAADTWGRTWSSTEFSNTNFRVRIVNVASSTARDFSLDWVAVNVTYQ